MKIGTYTQAQLNNKRKYIRKRNHNLTYRKGKTKRTKETELTLRNFIITGTVAMYLFCGIYHLATSTRTITIQGGANVVEAKTEIIKQVVSDEVDYSGIPYISREKKTERKETRETTMYNAGDPFQCDNTPCISASGDNICMLLAQGTNVCAANWLPIGTKIEVEGLGECIVLDRMAKRFSHRVDWAMQAHEKPEAIAFGLKRLSIKILK